MATPAYSKVYFTLTTNCAVMPQTVETPHTDCAEMPPRVSLSYVKAEVTKESPTMNSTFVWFARLDKTNTDVHKQSPVGYRARRFGPSLLFAPWWEPMFPFFVRLLLYVIWQELETSGLQSGALEGEVRGRANEKSGAKTKK